MSLALRPGRATDIEAVMAVMERAFDPAFGEAWNRPQCLGILSLPDVWLVLAEEGDGGATHGFALGRRTLDEAELLLLAVDPAARRCGMGGALIEHVVALAAGRGVTRLLLEVRSSNPALALYRAAGFAEVGRRRDYYRGADGRSYDALTLARTIG